MLTSRLIGSGTRHAIAKTARFIRAAASSGQRDAADEPELPELSAVASSESKSSPESAIRAAARPEHAAASAVDPADAPAANGRPAGLAERERAKRAAVVLPQQRVLSAVSAGATGDVQVADRSSEHVETRAGAPGIGSRGGLLSLRSRKTSLRRSPSVHEDRGQSGNGVSEAKLCKGYREGGFAAATMLRGRAKCRDFEESRREYEEPDGRSAG